MKTPVVVLLVFSMIILYVSGESCNDVSECRDVFCKHDTTPTCELNLCSCGPPPYSYTCKLKGDCDRHTENCVTGWHCLNGKCRC